jgi:hypothetical protein
MTWRAGSVYGQQVDENEENIAIKTWSPILDDIGKLIEQGWTRSLDEVGSSDDPRMVSAQLFKRLKDHRDAFVVLLDARLYRDSEIIVRSAIEAAICLLNLNKRGKEFIADLRSDAANTLKGQIPIWFDGDPALGQASASGLESTFGAKRPDGSKHDRFRFDGLADQAAAPELYRWYKHLSGTSVHVTGISVFMDTAVLDDPEADGKLSALRRLGRVHALGMISGAALLGCRAHADTLGYSDLLPHADELMARLADASALIVPK